MTEAPGVVENWSGIAAGFAVATVASKIDRSKDKTVQEIADAPPLTGRPAPHQP